MENLSPQLGLSRAATANGPMHAVDMAPPAPANAPPHTHTESTLAPTSEFVRYLLLALPARYTFRAVIEALGNPNAPPVVAKKVGKVMGTLWKHFHINPHMAGEIAYDYALGLGSLGLTTTYTRLVYKDIQNMFCETVGLELGKPADQVTFGDISKSNNTIVAQTLKNFKIKTTERYGTDILFFARAIPALRWIDIGDAMVGVKAALALGDTWKRKTTVFEDLVTFVNNKINPRNGLGQPIGVGEIFDLYQHYSQVNHPKDAFNNVLERGTGEGQRWAQAQPIFQRMTELMNLTYAYKHSSLLDPQTGHAVRQADFALPVFIYLLGHDLINVTKPEETKTVIEVANRYGIAGVKQMEQMLANGATLDAVKARYPTPPVPLHSPTPDTVKNEVIPKGSTMQIDAVDAPTSKIDPRTIGGHVPMLQTDVLQRA